MALPSNFQPAEHFQDVCKTALNREIREWFADVADELDLNAPRASLRVACTHQESDSLLLTIGRLLLFESTVRKGSQGDFEFGDHPNHAVPRARHPQVVLIWTEDGVDVDPGYSPVAGRVSFRLMNETGASMSESKLLTLANKIKTGFGNSAHVWKKGRKMLSYTDWDLGYQLQLLCFSEAEGRTLIGKILDLQNHSPNWANAQLKENLEESEAYPVIPPSRVVLGKSRKLARRRPRADVRFQTAWISIPGLPNKIYLYDRSGLHPEAMVRPY